jgi:hypothetical protein
VASVHDYMDVHPVVPVVPGPHLHYTTIPRRHLSTMVKVRTLLLKIKEILR